MISAARRTLGAPHLLAVAGLVLLALALRLPSFDDSIWGDELSTNYVVNGFGQGSVFDVVSSDQEGTPPLFFVLTWLTKWIGAGEGLRTVSLLAGLASIPLVYALGLRTVGQRGALVAAALLALSPFQIFYSTEARSYELVMCLGIAAALVLLVALERRSLWWWAGYAVLVAATALTHYSSAFLLLALFCWAFVTHPEARRRLLLATAGAALLFLPWIPQFIADNDTPAAKVIELVHPLTVSAALADLRGLSIGHPLLGWREIPGELASWLIVAGIAIGAAAAALAWRRDSGWRPSSRLLLVVLLAVATPLGAALQGAVSSSVFLQRNLIVSLPAIALLAGALATAGRPPLRWVATGLLLVGFAAGAVKLLDAGNQRPDYDGAAAFIQRSAPPGSPVVEVTQTTPGPQTAMQAALARKGEPLPRGRAVQALDFPTYGTLIDASRRDVTVQELLALPRPAPRQTARLAAREAGDGTLIFVAPAGLSLEDLRGLPGATSEFLAALPPRFHEVDSATFEGLGPNDLTVHVLSGAAQ